ncbi:Gfo/Idh/MocA family protein [Terriglobus roseus]|nr:Gfo/Idh/MocA family oxidoreductase [Terriglobus roseus]
MSEIVNIAANETTGTSRRSFLRTAGGAVAAVTALGAAAAQQKPNAGNEVQLSQIHASTEAAEKAPGPFLPTNRRVGFAIVGLGRLSLNQILPAFAKSDSCKPVALVSGDRGKALKIAAQYGIAETSITDYAGFEKLKEMPGVDVIYIVLPNGMHREFVMRAAKMGKHILCEKPMANSAAECEEMIAACKAANVKLMIAYRQQYEPMNRTLEKAVRDGRIGTLRSIVASNSQDQGDPTQWRLNKKLAGGGAMPDVGIYCLNAARFLTGIEPEEVFATVVQPKDDPRFREVEARCEVIARFPNGVTATFTTAYDTHRSAFLRLEGSDGFAEMDPAFGYHGSKLRFVKLMDGKDTEMTPSIEDKDQFALEMDHMASCVTNNQQPHTGGEEGLQDMRLVEAIYKSAATARSVKVTPPTGPTRGPGLPAMES